MGKFAWSAVTVMWIATMLVIGVAVLRFIATPTYKVDVRIDHITITTLTDNQTIGFPDTSSGLSY